MTTSIRSTPASTARVVPLTRALSMGRRFPRVAAVIAHHFPDALSLLGAGLFLAIAIGASVYGSEFLDDARLLDGAIGKVFSFTHPYGR